MYFKCIQFILKVEYYVPKIKYTKKNKLHKVIEKKTLLIISQCVNKYIIYKIIKNKNL